MKRKMYTNDFKVSLMQEFTSSGVGISKFAATKDIQLSTFRKWLYDYRKYGTPVANKTLNNDSTKPIDITKEAKQIISESKVLEDQKISLEINGITIKIPLKNLKIVLVAIQNV